MRLFDRDRRSVALTAIGAALLPKTRALLAQADELHRSVTGMAAAEPVRLGYVSWRPADLVTRVCGAAARGRVGHAVAHPGGPGRRPRHRPGDLLGTGRRPGPLRPPGAANRRRPAVRGRGGPATAPVRAKDTLADADTSSWASWNGYAEEFARDTGARIVRIDDGGVTGPAFYDQVGWLRRPVLNSPKGQTTPLPPDLPPCS